MNGSFNDTYYVLLGAVAATNQEEESVFETLSSVLVQVHQYQMEWQ